MGKKHSFSSRELKLTLSAFLLLDDANLTDSPTPHSVTPPTVRIQKGPPIGHDLTAHYILRDDPTPMEVYASKTFIGLCLECQMIFASWKQPQPSHKKKSAHHNFMGLKSCWCPLCKLLLCELHRYNEEALQALQLPANCFTSSDVIVYKHVRHVPCYYVELMFNLYDRRLMPSFMMFAAGWDSHLTAGTPQSSTDCDTIWKLANKWLRECKNSHGFCATTYLAEMLPTRLVDVGTNNNELRVVLSESLPHHTEYATLSHCWGSKPFMTLTRKNFDAFLVRIQFERLSKTFRDAITAARNLGFRYLWIDSLCIIQEDEEDWRCEANKMSSVYSNSSLTIAAADSPDGDIGCFFNDRPGFPNAWKVTFPPQGPFPLYTMHWDSVDKNASSIEHTWNCINRESRAVIDESCLASRAWTFQERLLSPRTLYFGRNQIAWECRDFNAYESVPDLFEEGITRLSPGNFMALLDQVTPLADTNNVRFWSDLVEVYSKRRLTFSRDKLVAISGLARIIAPVYGTDYVAGLWVKDLVRLLAWHKKDLDSTAAPDTTTTYRAPSWSWASVDGGVLFPRAFVLPLEGKYADVNDDDSTRRPLAKVLEAATTYLEDQYGQVTSGFVSLRVQALFRVNIDTRKWLYNRHFSVHILGVGIVEQFTAYPDYSLESIDGDSLLIPLVDGEDDYPNDYPEMRGLILEYIEDGVYRRKGAWRIGGEYSHKGLGAEHYKVARMWWTKGADRMSDRAAAGLDKDEYAGLWDGEAYVVKII